MPVKVDVGVIRITEDLSLPSWVAVVPEIRAVSEDERRYVQYYVSRGMSLPQAERATKERFQGLFNRVWLQGLREMIGDRGREYQKLFPDLRLRGFDPQVVQRVYIPGENTGRRGKPFVRKLLLEMGKRQRAKEVEDV